MNELILIVPSNMKKKSDIIRFAKSVDVSEHIHVYFINQSPNVKLAEVYKFEKCIITEIVTSKVIPLSIARNLALKEIYTQEILNNNVLVMFPDDDSWFPVETLEYLLSCNITSFALKTIDPTTNKSFNKVTINSGEIKNWHLIHDICSICLVVPLAEISNKQQYFNENLGLGNIISQGEESLFIYELASKGVRFYYDRHMIYHPYKKQFNMKNFYSLSYFWSAGLVHKSKIFLWPCFKYLSKYTIAVLLGIKDSRYIEIFRCVWKGAMEGAKDKYQIFAKQ